MSSGTVQAERTGENEGDGNGNIVCLPFSLDGPLFDAAAKVYAEAFAGRPYYMEPKANERTMRTRLGSKHARKPGLTTIAALHGGDVVGMTYGYHLAPGDWWGDLVRAALSPQSQRNWLSDAFILVEIGVAPALQGCGIGPLLINALLTDRPERAVVLSTRTDARAHNLYRRLGFEVLTEMRFEQSAWHFIMGRHLP